MPTYLTPNVYVEETSYRSKSIDGVGTSTAAFIGMTRWGPVDGSPDLITSLSDFQRRYGGLEQLTVGFMKPDGATVLPTRTTNFLAQAVNSFFQEGGSQCYVQRVVSAKGVVSSGAAIPGTQATSGLLPAAATPAALAMSARYPGAMGNLLVTLTVAAQDCPDLAKPAFAPGETVFVLVSAKVDEELRSEDATAPAAITTAPAAITTGCYFLSPDGQNLTSYAVPATTVALTALSSAKAAQILTITNVTLTAFDADKRPLPTVYQFNLNCSFQNSHPNALTNIFPQHPPDRATEIDYPVFVADGGKLLPLLTLSDGTTNWLTSLAAQTAKLPATTGVTGSLTGGSDGGVPLPLDYEGSTGADGQNSGLMALGDRDDISIVAAPGSTYAPSGAQPPDSTIQSLLIAHCETFMYRVAVLDSPPGLMISEVADYRSQFNTTRAALYYPWVKLTDPVTNQVVSLPPSGFVAGIYARTDTLYDVSKAPANAAIMTATGLETSINATQQGVLNPIGINCIRFFKGSGFLVWGARTLASDPDWKYVNVRRYMAYLEHSINASTKWAVFENNGPALWASVRSSITDFLTNEWLKGRLFGTSVGEAFFVKCDMPTTMTQNDIDNGRLICQVGVSVLRPAEFVIFQIGQWTGA